MFYRPRERASQTQRDGTKCEDVRRFFGRTRSGRYPTWVLQTFDNETSENNARMRDTTHQELYPPYDVHGAVSSKQPRIQPFQRHYEAILSHTVKIPGHCADSGSAPGARPGCLEKHSQIGHE
ncbi:hypothetical protein DOTSEDRAFT_67528 [Dothistroma septosporum NZE10]|uniref:Uncharacterized protein n=1 Tax=Dothistroma septosporum (strain NZE10 / CBS 128990) TaxID=675120 RepID=N1PYL0_DOTSN|nr:hypothetical protein DOTSEDRAFT_67528 [Dothistroma septosporum NZE10]